MEAVVFLIIGRGSDEIQKIWKKENAGYCARMKPQTKEEDMLMKELIEVRLVLMKRHIVMLERILDEDESMFWSDVIRYFSWIKLDVLELLALYGLLFPEAQEKFEPLIASMSDEEQRVLFMFFQDKELETALDVAGLDTPTMWCQETCSYLRIHRDIFQSLLRKLQQRFC